MSGSKKYGLQNKSLSVKFNSGTKVASNSLDALPLVLTERFLSVMFSNFFLSKSGG